ncbi:PREDICTED: probable phospholipid-transporting ATPase VA isoform X2 [Ceratosolen solmsi marchali]|uniref:Phospholipid-transporting ATPase n=1 Tax=Ceratosolen solmsi marchali TaxID=326594 RepID=A0AAJ6YBG7_9HYME|nr:PREDICTED: probable phospholipid-transporting ATPase VA isoform X2 [Ceratosolen solmsi marchali]
MSEKEERSSLYVFPSPSSSLNPVVQMTQVRQIDQEYTVPTGPITIKTHTRSASHGGVLASVSRPSSSNLLTARQSALKKPGHQRAFSQGQVVEVPIAGSSRIGSKTDFILPPGHREDRPQSPNTGKTTSHGHSRQASRSESIYTIRRSAAPPWWRRAWIRYFGFNSEEAQLRNIAPSHLLPSKLQSAVDNRIRTTKYNTLTFLPRNLLEQSYRVANVYFIFIVLLNWVPAINAFGKEIAMIPVVFVLGVTALKDFFEDRRRLASDKRVNNSTCRVYFSEGDRYMKIPWKDVKVGDFVHLSNNEIVPAALLLLRSSDPQGFAYLDTCNLDGETNLKQRQVIRGFLDLQADFQPSKFRSIIEVDRPSTKIYRFHGAVIHPNGSRIPVSTENLLLRECLLKNTDFIEGIVVYVGHETKAMLNNGGPRYKRSRLECQMNLDVIWCVIILIVLCIVGAAGCRFWLSAYTSVGPVPFLPIIQDPAYEGILTFWTFIIILQVMIPLSLYVTIEMAKVGQVYHIMNDTKLYDSKTNRPAECRALNITEELGQVQYIFSDKTGTLTENKMLFRRCAIGGQDYTHTGDGENLVACTRLKEDLLIGTCRHRLQEFLILLAICNTVVVNTHPHRDIMNSSGVIENTQKNDDADPTRPKLPNLPTMSTISMLTKRLSPLGHRNNLNSMSEKNVRSLMETQSTLEIYEAESPDELTLVQAARAYNVRLTRRTTKNVIVSLPDKSILTFEILKILPFDSNRKCMSIVVKHPRTGEIVLYCKGADSTILSALNSNEEESIITTKVRQHLHSYARQGLRTLVMARRSLTAQEYECWLQKHIEIETSNENSERRIRESYTNLECQLSLLGATGIEDKLQAGVPEAMTSLVAAGIIVWVLTGDKPETAVNIAYSACLFSPTMQLLHLQARSKSMAESLIHTYLEAIECENMASVDSIENIHMQSNEQEANEKFTYRIGNSWHRQRALIVDGKTLTFILDPRSGLTVPFLKLTRACSSVLACRATPLQKAYIVKVVKEHLRMRTLAIGDGANDVSMIQTADVGIGVSGREGTQALMAADFAIASFPMLTRLLLMHGHWCYDRLSRMILYFFYKNATFVFLIFWFQLYCGFSGTVMVDQIYLLLYNLLFTSLPPLMLGIYDQIAPAKLLLESPRLYERGRLASAYQPHSFWITMADALYQSIIIFFFTEAAYHDSDVDIWEFGSTITTSCIIVMLIHISIETKSWTMISAAANLVSFGVFFGFSLLYNTICINCMGLPGSYWVMQKAIGQHIYWLTVILTSILAILPRIIYKSVKNTISPDMMQRATIAYLEKTRRFENQIVVGKGNGFVAGWSRSTQRATIRAENYTSKKSALSTIIT